MVSQQDLLGSSFSRINGLGRSINIEELILSIIKNRLEFSLTCAYVNEMIMIFVGFCGVVHSVPDSGGSKGRGFESCVILLAGHLTQV